MVKAPIAAGKTRHEWLKSCTFAAWIQVYHDMAGKAFKVQRKITYPAQGGGEKLGEKVLENMLKSWKI